jgi:hypothetical protein
LGPKRSFAAGRFRATKPNKIFAMHELERWANFYLLAAGAAATLIGLLFVVITLGAERRPTEAPKIPIYLTPAVIYFASVLMLAGLLIFPTQSRLTANFCICLVGVAGLVYSGAFLFKGGSKTRYYGLHDRIVHAAPPFAAYVLLVSGGVLFLYYPQRGLTLAAVGVLLLLGVAIRNSWAIAVDLASSRSDPH